MRAGIFDNARVTDRIMKGKILFIIPHAPYWHLDNRIKSFRQHPDVPVVKRTMALTSSFDKIIFVSGSSLKFRKPILFDNIEYHTIKGSLTLGSFLKSYDLKLLVLFVSLVLRHRHKLRVLNFSMASSSVILCFFSRLMRITFVTYFTGVPEQAHAYKRKIILDYKLLLLFSKKVIANNPVIIERLQLINRRSDFRLIPNFIEEEFKARKGPRKPFSVLYAGRLDPEKRVDILLRAFEIVVGKIPKAQLYITGTGSCCSMLNDSANELALEDSVHFLGWLPRGDIPRWMNRCMVFVQPSLYEGFPNALLEAMASGLAVVAMDVPYARWVVGDAGLLADAESVDALAQCIGRLLVDDKYRMICSEKARLRASRFMKDTVVKMLVQVIR